jgi:FkbM family methyltransferase
MALEALQARLLGNDERDVRILTGASRGMRMRLNRTTDTRKWVGRYERDTQSWLKRLSTGGDAWDIGAHIGYFSLVLSRSNARVIAVEASPENAARVAAHALLNGANIVVANAAVAGINGTVDLRIHEDSHQHSAWANSGLVEGVLRTEQVTAITLDALLDRYGAPGLVKIDIEGLEGDALRGAPLLLGSHPNLVIETHGPDNHQFVLDLLRKSAYAVSEPRSNMIVAT